MRNLIFFKKIGDFFGGESKETIQARKILETKKAIFIENRGTPTLIPKSHIRKIEQNGDILTLTIPVWFFNQNLN